MRKTLQYNVGTYNCKVGRDHQQVRAFVYWLLHHFDLKVLLLQEAAPYDKVLGSIKGYTLYQSHSAKDSDNVAILVKDGFFSRFRLVKTFKRRWWGAKHRRWHAPRTLLMVRAWGVLWVNWHRLAYQTHEVNRQANREMDDWIIQRFRNFKRRLGMSGDMNDNKATPVMRRVIKACKFRAIGSGVEFVMFKGNVRMSNYQVVEQDGGSDHHPKVWRVTVLRWFRVR